MTVVVTGGSGGLGREVMRALADLGRPALAASRRTGFDLATGAGLGHVLAHAEVVIHAATHPLRPRTVDLDGTRRMIKVLQREGPPPHLVYVSIVGCDRNPYPYYRAKHACEVALQRSGLPVTVVRATQFHSLVEAIARGATLGPIALAPKLTFQSCDPAWVAGRLVEVALGRPPVGFLRGDDLAGPEQVTLGEAITKIESAAGRPSPKLLTLPAIGGTLRAFAAGSNLPDGAAQTGGVCFSQWLGR